MRAANGAQREQKGTLPNKQNKQNKQNKTCNGKENKKLTFSFFLFFPLLLFPCASASFITSSKRPFTLPPRSSSLSIILQKDVKFSTAALSAIFSTEAWDTKRGSGIRDATLKEFDIRLCVLQCSRKCCSKEPSAMGRDVAVRRDNVVKSNTKDKGMAMSSSDIKSGELEESNFFPHFCLCLCIHLRSAGRGSLPGRSAIFVSLWRESVPVV